MKVPAEAEEGGWVVAKPKEFELSCTAAPNPNPELGGTTTPLPNELIDWPLDAAPNALEVAGCDAPNALEVAG